MPFPKSQSFLEVPAEIAPEDIVRSALAFEDSPVPLFPDSPKREAWDELPKGVEERAVVGGYWPIVNKGIKVFPIPALSSAFEAYVIP